MGKKYIHLSYPYWGDGIQSEPVYRVDMVENSTEFQPGQYLSKDQVDALCEMASWNVKMRRNLQQ